MDQAAARADERFMRLAVATAADSRLVAPPNPWVGAVVTTGGPSPAVLAVGATAPPGGPHAEVQALDAAGAAARGGTLYVTLEPCVHHGRTPPCTERVLEAGVRRVVVGTLDPDARVAGRGVAALEAAGIEVVTGVLEDAVARQLAPYLHHRRTGRPYVVLKLAATLDGRIAAPDGSSRWITGPEARADVHRLRAESDAVLVGAGTVRADDPSLTVRDHTPACAEPDDPPREPLRVVLGRAGETARVRPALELAGDLGEVLDELGRRDVLQLLVEGGAGVSAAFHRERLVDRYVVYLAPALLGGDDSLGLFRGPGAATIAEAFRGRFDGVERLGDDLRVELVPV